MFHRLFMTGRSSRSRIVAATKPLLIAGAVMFVSPGRAQEFLSAPQSVSPAMTAEQPAVPSSQPSALSVRKFDALPVQKHPVLLSRIQHETAADEILVTLAPDADSNQTMQQMNALGAVAHTMDALHTLHIRLKHGANRDAVLARLRKQSGVVAAEANGIVRAADIVLPNDPYISGTQEQQWGPLRTGTNLAWSIWKPCNTKPVIIAIVDTGVDSTHPDLVNMMLRDANGNVIGHNTLTGQDGPALDDDWHGTHCAGVAAAQTNNGTGIAGMAGWTGSSTLSDTTHVKVMPVKVLDNSGNGTNQSVADGITWAADHGANIISLSLGAADSSYVLSQAVSYAWSKGCLVCAAAGNYGMTARFYPAYYPNVLSVAATVNNASDSLASYSEYGTWVKIAAPGDNICSTIPGSGYASASGTSMATPHVAGLAALIWAQNPRLTNQQVYNYIVGTADKYPANANPIAAGGGRINSYAAISAVQAATPLLSGTVSLQGCVNMAQTLTVSFTAADGLVAGMLPITLVPTTPGFSVGTFTLSGIPNGQYTLGFKGAKWLKKNLVMSGPLTALPPVQISLLSGDCNNDNYVDIGDFGILVNSYNSSQGNSGYDSRCDLNCDGVIDISDFGLLVNNYGTAGDS